MARFDRYMLSQLLLFFGFFALVLVAVFWISRAVRLFDRLIADGQSVIVFLEFTALGLPRIILLVLPIASFAAAVYVTNRLAKESEITVIQATGASPWRLARPVFVFGLIVGLMVLALAHLLVPAALDQLSSRQNEINQDVSARLLIEGTFVHPSDGVTIYTGSIDEDGVLRDVFLSDRRDPNVRVIYTADTAYLIRQDGSTSIIMVDGIAQRYDPETRRLTTGTYLDFSYDISGIVDDSDVLAREVRAMTTPELLEDWESISARTHQPIGIIAEEYHSRFAQPIFAMVTALFGFSVLISSGFSRLGGWQAVIVSFTLLLVLDGLRAALADPLRDDPSLWPIAYLPAVTGLAMVGILLMWTAAPSRPRGAVAR